MALAGVAFSFWAAGQFAEDLARVFAGMLVLVAIVMSRRGETSSFPTWAAPLLSSFLISLPFLFFAHGWSRVLAGRMGVDFAIFTQSVHSIATVGLPSTSLLGPEPVAFLTHHFAPILYVPGALAFVGMAPPLALLLAQAIAVAASLLGIRVAAQQVGLTKLEATALTLAVGLGANVRPELLWGVHDEVLSVPFAIWAVVALLRGQPRLSMVLMLLSALGKESYFALPPVWCFIVWRWSRPSRSVLLTCALLAGCSVAAGAFYVFGQPLWADKPFDHFDKLAPAASGLALTIGPRALFVFSFFGWLLMLPLVSARSRLLSLLPAPFIALGLVANDPEMYRFTGYHSIVPQLLLGLAAGVGLADSGPKLRRVAPIMLSALICLSLSWNARSLWKAAREASEHRWYPDATLSAVPKDVAIAADPAAALVLLDHRVVRLFTAETFQLPVGLVVARPDGWEKPGPPLESTYSPCSTAPPWLTLCPK